MKVRERIWVGIDVGKAHHHACAVNAAGTVVFSKRLGNGQAEIEALIARAGKAGQVRWALDMTSGTAGLLLAVLRQAGAEMVYVPGRLVHRMAGAFAGEGKSDAKDAFTIAETARLRGDLTVITDPDQLVMQLQVLTARREDLMGDWVPGVNRLRDLLASTFPALDAAFDYSTRSALVLLTGFQTPAGTRDAGPVGLAEHLRTRGAWPKGIPAMADKALAAAATQTIALPTETTVAPLIARLAAHLSIWTARSRTSTSRSPPRSASIHMRRGSPASTGSDRSWALTCSPTPAGPADCLRQFGLAPVPRDSGRVRGNLHRPKRYHRGLRRVFYLAALSAIKPDGPSKTFYQRKRAEGKLHTQAVIALARRLIDVIWALLRDGRKFHTSPPITACTA